ncbi:hypothetical protein B0H19DRAFT_709375 [Mycena capillaripes]|nr:hypothetical protein B0H19DRAFT_709375 [Mycena capillaripes]
MCARVRVRMWMCRVGRSPSRFSSPRPPARRRISFFLSFSIDEERSLTLLLSFPCSIATVRAAPPAARPHHADAAHAFEESRGVEEGVLSLVFTVSCFLPFRSYSVVSVVFLSCPFFVLILRRFFSFFLHCFLHPSPPPLPLLSSVTLSAPRSCCACQRTIPFFGHWMTSLSRGDVDGTPMKVYAAECGYFSAGGAGAGAAYNLGLGFHGGESPRQRRAGRWCGGERDGNGRRGGMVG